MARTFRSRAAVLVAASCLLAGCVSGAARPGPAQMAAEAARLDTVLPMLEDLGVSRFTVEDGCAWLLYERGQFFEGGDSCQPDQAGPFDDIARADHARLAEALVAVGAPTGRVLDATLGPDGRLRTARFLHSAHPFPQTWEYIYDPGQVEPKVEGGPLEVVYTQVNDDWWFRSGLDD